MIIHENNVRFSGVNITIQCKLQWDDETVREGDIVECRYLGRGAGSFKWQYVRHARERREADSREQVEGESCDSLQ